MDTAFVEAILLGTAFGGVAQGEDGKARRVGGMERICSTARIRSSSGAIPSQTPPNSKLSASSQRFSFAILRSMGA